jgi:hypothetical protein
MPEIKLKFEGENLTPEDDDISSRYMLSRQVAHEYHSSATQTYINAESAAQQVQAEAALSEQAAFKKEQSKKQTEGKAAESSFAAGLMSDLDTRKPEATKSIGKAGEKVSADGGGGGWGDETAPVGMPSEQQKAQAETGGLEAPMIDPTQAAAAGAGASFALSRSAGMALMPSLARALAAGVVNTATDPIYGTAAEVVGASHPALALPFNLAVGLLGGMTIEPAIERGIIKAATAAGKTLDPAAIAEQVQMIKGLLANESGQVDVWHGSPHKFDVPDMSKVGTGEGAQAFGYGLYFTDKKEIAAHYGSLPDSNKINQINQKLSSLSKEMDQYRTGEWGKFKDPKGYKLKSEYDNLMNEKLDLKGSTYRAQLFPGKDPSEYTFLDWYEPVGKNEKLKELLDKSKNESWYQKLEEAQLGGPLNEQATVRDVYRAIEKELGSDKEASAFLKRAGIDGIRYPTETLSGKGPKGGDAFNYVVFDDKDVKLVSRESGGVVDDLTPKYKITDEVTSVKPGELGKGIETNKAVEEYKQKIMSTGKVMPVEIDEKGFIVDGEHRYKALIELGAEEIPVYVGKQSGASGRLQSAYRGLPVDVKVNQVDDLTKSAVIEEINAEIGKHPVDDALRILKSQKGELLISPGSEGQPPAPVKGGKSGTPKPLDEFVGPNPPAKMQAKADKFLANTNPDITKETAGNIRLWGADLEPKFMGEIETPEDIMRVVTGTHEAFAKEQEAARRGVRSWEETAQEAKKYKIEDLLGRKMGQALNAEQVDNARTLLVSSADTLRGMATIVRSGQANDLQKADFMRAFNVHYAIQMQLSGAAAEAGRALQIFRKVATSDTMRVGQIKDFLAATATNKITPESIADALSTMTTPSQVSNFVKQAKRATTWDMFQEAWINGLLSGPVTHAVNTTSNMLTALWMIPERALAAGISRVHGGEIRGGEVAAQTFGLVHGFKDGLKLAWEALKKGETSDLMGKVEQQQQRAISAKNIAQLPVIKKLAPNALEEGGIAARAVDALGEFIRLPGRFLGAEDELFKSVGYRMELQAQAYRKGVAEGLEGTALSQRIRDIISDPQNLAPEVHLAAIDAARYQTFTKDLGPGGKAVQTAANKIPGLKLVIPFIRTPANIMKFAAERTVLAPLMKSVRDDIAAGGARRDMALARISLGSMAMGVTAAYAAAGYITGGGPSDTSLRSHLFNTGWQPYSIKIGDTYYSYGRLEPIGMMMGLAADAVEIGGEIGEMESNKVATTIVAAISKNVMSKTWLRGLSEMVHAMDDPDRYGKNYVKQFAGTAVPSAVAQVERVMYPELSDAQTALDAIKARTPGFSNDLPTRRNLWGEKIQFNGGLGPDIISPIFTSKEKDRPIDKEMLRMKAPIRMPNRTQSFEGVPIKLDPYEYEEFIVRMNAIKLDSTGKNLKTSLKELVTKDKDYKALKDDDQKERMIRANLQEAKEKAIAEMLDKSPTLRLLVDDEHRRQAAAQ